MTSKKTATTYGKVTVSKVVQSNLAALCSDLLYWRNKGVLPENSTFETALDLYVEEKGFRGTSSEDAGLMLEGEIHAAAMDLVAKGAK